MHLLSIFVAKNSKFIPPETTNELKLPSRWVGGDIIIVNNNYDGGVGEEETVMMRPTKLLLANALSLSGVKSIKKKKKKKW